MDAIYYAVGEMVVGFVVVCGVGAIAWWLLGPEWLKFIGTIIAILVWSLGVIFGLWLFLEELVEEGKLSALWGIAVVLFSGFLLVMFIQYSKDWMSKWPTRKRGQGR